jgi:O-antigen ligase
LLSSLVGLVQYRTGVDPVYLLHLRAAPAMVEAPGVPGRYGAMGFFTSRLGFGHVVTVLLALIAGLLAERAFSRRESLLIAGVGLIGLAAVAVTFDRGAWLGLCAAAMVVALLAAPQARKAVVPVLLLIGAVASLDPPVRARFASAFSAQENTDRVFIWARAAEIIRDHPLRGVGFANYQRMLGPYYDRVDPHFVMRTYAHNLELSTLAETGPLGLFAMLAIVAVAAAALWRRRAVGGLAALAAWFAIAQVHDVFYDTKVMYALWFALGLSLRTDATVLQEPPPARAG